VLAALVAAGLVSESDPRVAQAYAIHEQLTDYGRSHGPSAAALPDPWRSLLTRRGGSGGPRGTLLVGAVTPVFDRISATIMALESSDEAFRCEFELTGPVAMGMHGGGIDSVAVTFAATDDRGNHYLGQPADWSGGDSAASGTLEFGPALDPRAAVLDIAVTTDRARAVITVPLHWDDAR
jgi:hypothetical protein